MRPFIIFTFIITICFQKLHAQNLVPNPSFEDTVAHNGLCIGPVEWATHWFNPTSTSPDLYTFNASVNCTNSSMTNPSGFQLPRTGNTYIGLYTFAGPTREYIAITLDSTLSAGCSYYVEFFYSQANNFGLATDKLGCAFTSDTAGFYIFSGVLPLSTAIESPAGLLLNDTLNWNKISGNYFAVGGEKYLLLGNFYNDSSTTIDTSHSALYYNAYYYIDDVIVLPCNVPSSDMIMSHENYNLKVYPNPTSGEIQITNLNTDEIYGIEIYDVFGNKTELNNSFKSYNKLSLVGFSNGVYILEITSEHKQKVRTKIIISN